MASSMFYACTEPKPYPDDQEVRKGEEVEKGNLKGKNVRVYPE